jgi:hypothetical protein
MIKAEKWEIKGIIKKNPIFHKKKTLMALT